MIKEDYQRLLADKEALMEEHKNLSSHYSVLKNENEGLLVAVKELRKFVIGEESDANTLKKKILFYGDSRIEKQEMYEIARTIGIDSKMLEIHDDYDKNRTRAFINKNSSRFLGVIVSASAHKAKDIDGATSPAKYFSDILPTVETRTTSGELKCTKESFKRALEKMYWDLVSKGLIEEICINNSGM